MREKKALLESLIQRPTLTDQLLTSTNARSLPDSEFPQFHSNTSQ